MTDFVAETRHYCRNPRCRSKLPAPVANPREAFCVRGCHSGFYRTRCLVCEAKMERRRENQLICGKRKCRNALRGGLSLGRYHASSAVIDPARNPIKPGLETAPAGDRPWRIVRGPEVSPTSFHCATVPDGPDCAWEGGEYRRIEARNRAMLREHFRKQAAKCLIQPHHPPVNVLGGYRFPGAPDIDLSPIAPAPSPPSAVVAIIGDGLDIPQFLLRRPKAA